MSTTRLRHVYSYMTAPPLRGFTGACFHCSLAVLTRQRLPLGYDDRDACGACDDRDARDACGHRIAAQLAPSGFIKKHKLLFCQLERGRMFPGVFRELVFYGKATRSNNAKTCDGAHIHRPQVSKEKPSPLPKQCSPATRGLIRQPICRCCERWSLGNH